MFSLFFNNFIFHPGNPLPTEEIMKNLFFISFLFLLIPAAMAQEKVEYDHDHHSQKNEVGGAIGMFFDLEEKVMSSGFHLHYTRILPGKLQHFGISPGFEFLFGVHKHYAFHLMFSYRPIQGWWIGAGPGISYFDHHDEFQFSGHAETGYEFDAGMVHFGPVVEFSWARDDQHVMLGLHLGVPF